MCPSHFVESETSQNHKPSESEGSQSHLTFFRVESRLGQVEVEASHKNCPVTTNHWFVDHVVLQCPIHRPPHGLHGLTVMDDETIEWLLNTCSEI